MGRKFALTEAGTAHVLPVHNCETHVISLDFPDSQLWGSNFYSTQVFSSCSLSSWCHSFLVTQSFLVTSSIILLTGTKCPHVLPPVVENKMNIPVFPVFRGSIRCPIILVMLIHVDSEKFKLILPPYHDSNYFSFSACKYGVFPVSVQQNHMALNIYIGTHICI